MKFMLIYSGIMVAGILIGYFCKSIPTESKLRNMLQYALLFILLFVLGYQLGGNEEVLNSLTSMGLYGLLFAAASMVGSFFLVLLARKLFERMDITSGKARNDEVNGDD